MDKKHFWNLMNFYCRAHPWHGIDLGEDAPSEIHCYVEIVPTDTVKFELEKESGLLKADRPQKYSNYCPCLYGLIPQTYAGDGVGNYCSEKSGRPGIKGDNDPLDICILTEKPILRGDIVVTAIPIGGIRAIDNGEADDKIIAVLKDDLVYKDVRDLADCPANLIERLQHYFLTYKESPDDLVDKHHRRLEIQAMYNREEAMEIIQIAREDYNKKFAEEQRILQEFARS
jgi:inorganic pyrophosphatase